MLISKIYHTWKHKIEQLRPQENLNRTRGMAWLLAGIFVSRSVQLGRVASKLPGKAIRRSSVRRLERLVDNRGIRVREWYEPVIKAILQAQAGREYRLVVDGSKVGPWHILLMVGQCYRKRVIPVAWMWVRTPNHKGRSSAARQVALLGYVRSLLPDAAQVLLCGDQEFGGITVLEQLDIWGWSYVFRQKSSYVFRPDETSPWKPFGEAIRKPGQQIWLGKVTFTQQRPYPTNLLAYWQIGEKDPWLLATNLPTLSAALKAYARRPWIEETFGDLKDNGFDLESSRLRSVMHLQRLTLAVMLLYLDMLATGSRAIKNGLRRLVDRTHRRDLSIFRIGFYIRDRYLANDLPFTIHLLPILTKTVG